MERPSQDFMLRLREALTVVGRFSEKSSGPVINSVKISELLSGLILVQKSLFKCRHECTAGCVARDT
jgi:hypothetical protein